MTAQERSELQALTCEVSRLANEQKALNEKVSDLLIGRTANCATEAGRITALEDRASRLEQAQGELWERIWQLAKLTFGTSAAVSIIVSIVIGILMRK